MSQIEQNFRLYLSKHPEVETCYSAGLINRRSLARHLVKNGVAKGNQMEALIAMLRRFPFKKNKIEQSNSYKNIRINIKNKIIILQIFQDWP